MPPSTQQFTHMRFDSAFGKSWQAVSVANIRGIQTTFTGKKRYLAGGRTRRDPGLPGISGMRAGVELTIQADPEFQKFVRRLPKLQPQIRRHLARTIRRAVREEFLTPLRRNIPRRKGKQVTRVAKGTRIVRTRRGRTQVYGRKKHIRQTAKIAEAKPERIVVSVGSKDLWYGAALHARVPFFPMTVEETYPKLEKRLNQEMGGIMRLIATGRRGRF